MELVGQLKEDGIAKGLCQDWQKKLKKGLSIQRLVRLYIRGIDFCISNDYPTLEFVRAHFKGKCEPYGVYVDDEQVELNSVSDVVLLGNCKGVLNYGQFSVNRLYVRHNTCVNIKVYGYAHLTIDVFDNAHINLISIGRKTKVLINQYGNSKVTYSGDGVKVITKNKKTY